VMKDGFICTRDGKYIGLGSGMSLLKAMSDIEAEKTRQLLSSTTTHRRFSNPACVAPATPCGATCRSLT
jgi:hypothetical protein